MTLTSSDGEVRLLFIFHPKRRSSIADTLVINDDEFYCRWWWFFWIIQTIRNLTGPSRTFWHLPVKTTLKSLFKYFLLITIIFSSTVNSSKLVEYFQVWHCLQHCREFDIDIIWISPNILVFLSCWRGLKDTNCLFWWIVRTSFWSKNISLVLNTKQ